MKPNSELSRYDSLREAAWQVLNANQIVGKRSTQPAQGQYPHQWNWDSAFIAIGLACIDVERAKGEIEALLDGQWSNGMIPQIIYNPDPEKDKTYFPNQKRWGIELAAPGQGPSPGVDTSGITQPPMVAIAVEYIHKRHTDKEASLQFLDRVYPKLLKYHRYLLEDRDPRGEGLAFLVHPWESGLDNSPRWQSIIDAIEVDLNNVAPYERLDDKYVTSEQRPTRKDYDRYLYLIEVYKECKYDQTKLFEQCPFLVQDVLFNAILHRANRALLEIAHELGVPTGEIEEWMKCTQNSFYNKLWSEKHGRYWDFNMRKGEYIDQNTIATFIPLFAGLASPEQADRLVNEHLKNPKEYWPGDEPPQSRFLVPGVSKDNALWLPQCYWRGPIWVQTNWLVLKGLEAYGYEEEANHIRQDTLSLLRNPMPDGEDWWFWEYFNPLNGHVCGIDHFSWSAALAIELTSKSL